jgi:hypothetical protein
MAALVVYRNGLCMRAISSERGNNTLSVNLLLLIFLCVPYFPAYKTHQPIKRTVIFSLEILEKNDDECIINFSNLLEENRIVTYLVTRK